MTELSTYTPESQLPEPKRYTARSKGGVVTYLKRKGVLTAADLGEDRSIKIESLSQNKFFQDGQNEEMLRLLTGHSVGKKSKLWQEAATLFAKDIQKVTLQQTPDEVLDQRGSSRWDDAIINLTNWAGVHSKALLRTAAGFAIIGLVAGSNIEPISPVEAATSTPVAAKAVASPDSSPSVVVSPAAKASPAAVASAGPDNSHDGQSGDGAKDPNKKDGKNGKDDKDKKDANQPAGAPQTADHGILGHDNATSTPVAKHPDGTPQTSDEHGDNSTATPQATHQATSTSTPTASATPSASPTPPHTASPTSSPTASPTSSPTSSPTGTATSIATATGTAMPDCHPDTDMNINFEFVPGSDHVLKEPNKGQIVAFLTNNMPSPDCPNPNPVIAGFQTDKGVGRNDPNFLERQHLKFQKILDKVPFGARGDKKLRVVIDVSEPDCGTVEQIDGLNRTVKSEEDNAPRFIPPDEKDFGIKIGDECAGTSVPATSVPATTPVSTTHAAPAPSGGGERAKNPAPTSERSTQLCDITVNSDAEFVQLFPASRFGFSDWDDAQNIKQATTRLTDSKKDVNGNIIEEGVRDKLIKEHNDKCVVKAPPQVVVRPPAPRVVPPAPVEKNPPKTEETPLPPAPEAPKVTVCTLNGNVELTREQLASALTDQELSINDYGGDYDKAAQALSDILCKVPVAPPPVQAPSIQTPARTFENQVSSSPTTETGSDNVTNAIDESIAGKDYTVQAKDTVWAISIKAYGRADVDKIAKANKLRNSGQIWPGQVLRIP